MSASAPGGGAAEITIAILAGGRSTRMGRDKADIDLEGHTFLERAARIAVATGSPVVVVGRPTPPGWRVEGVRFVEDVHPGRGPLGGLVTALRETGTPVLLMACDMPLLDSASVVWLKKAWARLRNGDPELEALVPVTPDGRRQPLFSVYDASVLEMAEENLAGEHLSLKGLLALVRTEQIHPPDRLAARIRSVDTPGDYRALFTLPVLPEDLERIRPVGDPFARVRSRRFLAWGLLSLLLATLLVAFVMIITDATAHELIGNGDFQGLLTFLVMACSVGGWIVTEQRRSGLDLGRLFGPLPSPWPFGRIIGLVIGLLVFQAGLTILLDHTVPGFGEWLRSDGEDRAEASVMILFNMVLAGPLFEEVLFRGMLLHRWAHRLTPGRAVLWTSLLFAVLHPFVPGAFLFGAVMCGLYLTTGSLWIPVATHALSNLTPALVIFLAGRGSEAAEPERLGITVLAPMAVWTLLAGFFVVRYVVRTWPRRDTILPYYRGEEAVGAS